MKCLGQVGFDVFVLYRYSQPFDTLWQNNFLLPISAHNHSATLTYGEQTVVPDEEKTVCCSSTASCFSLSLWLVSAWHWQAEPQLWNVMWNLSLNHTNCFHNWSDILWEDAAEIKNCSLLEREEICTTFTVLVWLTDPENHAELVSFLNSSLLT